MGEVYLDTWQEDALDDFNPTSIELLVRDCAAHGETWITIPGDAKSRARLDDVPEELLVGREFECGGWCTTLRLMRRNLRAVYGFIYESGEDGLPCLEGSPDDEIVLTGFWD